MEDISTSIPAERATRMTQKARALIFAACKLQSSWTETSPEYDKTLNYLVTFFFFLITIDRVSTKIEQMKVVGSSNHA